MNILIFGVGRSGTKAVRIYLAYYMAKYINKCLWLNYEPYYWLSNGIINYEGVYQNVNSKQIMNAEDKLSKRHIRFIKNMKHSKLPTLTKFIRGNGRIDQICEIHQPEYIIGVIRPLDQVLASLNKFNWDFFSVGSIKDFKNSRIKIWNRFINDVATSDLLNSEKDFEIFESVKLDENWEFRNAFYWYVMNLALLNSKKKNDNFILINYDNFTMDSAKAIKDIFKINNNILDIKDPLFREPDSSKDNRFPFKIDESRVIRFLVSKINRYMFKLYDSNILLYFKSFHINSGYKGTLLNKFVSIKNKSESNSKISKKNIKTLSIKMIVITIICRM